MSDSKKVYTRIGTHNGTFHCDEALACFLLKLLPQFKDCAIIRTRDQKELDTCNVVVDVGGVFDPETNRFDHHQKTFTHTFSSLNPSKPWKIRLSSAGLVYVHFGEEIINHVLGDKSLVKVNFESDEERKKLVGILYDKIYEKFIMEIDAIDNGVDIADEKRYQITTNLSSRVGSLNPMWNETNANENELFEKAMALTGSEFLSRLLYYVNGWWPARSIVEKALNKRHEVHESGCVLLLEQFAPWKDHLFSLEKELGVEENAIKYLLFSDANKHWRIQCVPVNEHSFQNRLSLPEAWRGLRDEELSKVAEVNDCVFVHASGFIGGTKTYESVIEMAKKALKSC